MVFDNDLRNKVTNLHVMFSVLIYDVCFLPFPLRGTGSAEVI